ncbi:MAG: hypothetical protein H5T86_09315 [Armatimonadetes bacterium]|nr:hypothetical protein [Armatimonadota bacterium]
MEHHNKDPKSLPMDKTSCHWFVADGFRAVTTVTPNLLHALLRTLAAANEFALGQAWKLRERAVKVARCVRGVSGGSRSTLPVGIPGLVGGCGYLVNWSEAAGQRCGDFQARQGLPGAAYLLRGGGNVDHRECFRDGWAPQCKPRRPLALPPLTILLSNGNCKGHPIIPASELRMARAK